MTAAHSAASPASGGAVDRALLEDLAAASRILADQGVSTPTAMSPCATLPISSAS
jgi:hypothetical protein